MEDLHNNLEISSGARTRWRGDNVSRRVFGLQLATLKLETVLKQYLFKSHFPPTAAAKSLFIYSNFAILRSDG